MVKIYLSYAAKPKAKPAAKPTGAKPHKAATLSDSSDSEEAAARPAQHRRHLPEPLDQEQQEFDYGVQDLEPDQPGEDQHGIVAERDRLKTELKTANDNSETAMERERQKDEELNRLKEELKTANDNSETAKDRITELESQLKVQKDKHTAEIEKLKEDSGVDTEQLKSDLDFRALEKQRGPRRIYTKISNKCHFGNFLTGFQFSDKEHSPGETLTWRNVMDRNLPHLPILAQDLLDRTHQADDSIAALDLLDRTHQADDSIATLDLANLTQQADDPQIRPKKARDF
ncbi:hypothetical protein Ddc_18630 [Ditylenchus destructor]|nr:hypothetical protein Ddc_18630 [Ditylenchus destructor]